MIVSPTVGGVIVALVAFQIVTLPDVQSERGGSRFAAQDRKLDRLHPSCLFICFAKNADGFKPCSQLATRRPNLADQLQSVEQLETTLIAVPVPGLFVVFFCSLTLARLAGFSSVCLPPCSREGRENTSVFLCKLTARRVRVCVCLSESQQAGLLWHAAEAQRGRWHLFDQGATVKEQ